MSAGELRFAVVGVGSIGSRHARNLRALGATEMALCDLDRSRALRLATEVEAIVATDDLDGVLTQYRPHAVLVCTPPSSHLEVASCAIQAGAHVFCEKPLAPSVAGVDQLLALCERHERFLMMGMCYRFHAGFRRLHQRIAGGTIGRVLSANLWSGQYLPDWHPYADYRTEYSARRALGGGVLLDSIHSLDVVRWALGEPVEAIGMLGQVSDLEIDTEDVAAATLRLRSGAIVEVHVDYLQRHRSSRCEVVGTEGNMTLDLNQRTLRWRRVEDDEWNVEPVHSEANEMYVAELCEFIDCVASNRAPALDGSEGRATLALADAIRASAETGRLIRLAVAAPMVEVA